MDALDLELAARRLAEAERALGLQPMAEGDVNYANGRYTLQLDGKQSVQWVELK